MTTTEAARNDLDLAGRAADIGSEFAVPYAEQVDLLSRFPSEAIEALRDDGQLSALVPTRLGGGGATITDVAEATFALARCCASTAMIYALHQLQVACIVRHGSNDFFECFLRDLASRQLLVASATTEIGTGGDLGSSICAVHRVENRFRLEKQAPFVSYGQYADAMLITARRCPDSAPADQVLVLCTPPGLLLEPISVWEAFGFRGTCSAGFHVMAEGDASAIVPVGFDVISAQTNLPVSHILWSHVWLGIAAEATQRARSYVQSERRKSPGIMPAGAVSLAELESVYLQMAALVRSAARRYDQICQIPELTSSMGYTIEMNSLKVAASDLVVDVVSRALRICGMAGYREDSPFTMGRLLRDAHGAAVMFNNGRLLESNSQMLLVHRGEL